MWVVHAWLYSRLVGAQVRQDQRAIEFVGCPGTPTTTTALLLSSVMMSCFERVLR